MVVYRPGLRTSKWHARFPTRAEVYAGRLKPRKTKQIFQLELIRKDTICNNFSSEGT